MPKRRYTGLVALVTILCIVTSPLFLALLPGIRFNVEYCLAHGCIVSSLVVGQLLSYPVAYKIKSRYYGYYELGFTTVRFVITTSWLLLCSVFFIDMLVPILIAVLGVLKSDYSYTVSFEAVIVVMVMSGVINLLTGFTVFVFEAMGTVTDEVTYL